MDGTPLRSEIEEEQSTLVRTPKTAGESSRRFPWVGCSVVALLAVIAIAVIIGVIFLVRGSNKEVSNQSNSSNVSNSDAVNKQLANLQQQQDEIDKQKQELANDQKTLTNQNTKGPDNKTPDNRAPANVTVPTATDPPTARITFHRGSVQETLSGTVVKKRSYVLRTLNGQYLSASITSSGNCVVFSNGTNSESYVTAQGDSNLQVVNNCASPAGFKLTVTVR